MNSRLLRPGLIAGASISTAVLSAVVAFGGFSDKTQAISVLATSALIYGIAAAWLESGYVLLRDDSHHALPAVFTLLVLIRVVVFLIAAAFGVIVTSFGLPVLLFALIAAGLSCAGAVIAATRSGRMIAAGVLYMLGAVGAASACLALGIREATTVVLVYALATGAPVVLFAGFGAGRGGAALARHMFQRTRTFIVDLPVTSLVENGDRVLLSMFATPAVLITYNGVKVAFGLQREFNRFLKQVTFHRLYDEARNTSHTGFTRRFLLAIAGSQVIALLLAFAAYGLIQKRAPEILLIFIALCVSTACTLVATHAIAGARAMRHATSAFVRANVIAVTAVAAAVAALMPFTGASGPLQPVYVVGGAYLAFYAIKTTTLFAKLKP